ncbi:MAG: hypothetical protein LJE70_00625 [Chromatiaceae bacterium]|nr:hypothetical protein [Chromatiaceae bacterium]
MNLSERQKGLLRLVKDYREQECRRILTAARKEAAEIRMQSFRKQRALLHSRVLEERSRARTRIQAARAERATQERWKSERMNLALLQSAWPLVRERLLARWQLADVRKRWALTAMRRAWDLLPPGRWTVRHAPDWREQERQAVLAELQGLPEHTPEFQSDTGIEAGLIIACGGGVLDASLLGLLQDRPGLEARLLALIAAKAGK